MRISRPAIIDGTDKKALPTIEFTPTPVPVVIDDDTYRAAVRDLELNTETSK